MASLRVLAVSGLGRGIVEESTGGNHRAQGARTDTSASSTQMIFFGFGSCIEGADDRGNPDSRD